MTRVFIMDEVARDLAAAMHRAFTLPPSHYLQWRPEAEGAYRCCGPGDECCCDLDCDCQCRGCDCTTPA